ncbi:MAG: CDP-glycerol glycerophosphotransferase family protein [Rhizomicrobium sp.]
MPEGLSATAYATILPVELLPDEGLHVAYRFEETQNQIVIFVYCRTRVFANLRGIYARSEEGDTELEIRWESATDDGYTYYVATIDRSDLSKKKHFVAVSNQNKQTKIWTAGCYKEALPAGFRFTKYQLRLVFEPDHSDELIDSRKCYIRKFIQTDNGLRVEVALFYSQPNDIDDAELVIFKYRNESWSKAFPLTFWKAKTPYRIPVKLHRNNTGLYVTNAWAEFSIGDGFDGSSIYSIMLKFKDGKLRALRPYNGYFQRRNPDFFWRPDNNLQFIHVFLDATGGNVRIEYFSFPQDEAEEALALIRGSKFVPSDQSWLVGEYYNTARDNGWQVFKYIRKNVSELEVKYIITDPNLDGISTSESGVVRYGSLSHLRAAIGARAVLFTHHALYVIPHIILCLRKQMKRKALQYFLQHGVLAIKPMLGHYLRSKYKDYDLFNVSSRHEQLLVASKTGWKPDDITICGLPRWDALFEASLQATENRAQERILIFPTWRAGLDKQNQDEFKQSAFFVHWFAGISRISERSRLSGVQADFCSHSIFERFAGLFQVPGINLVSMKEAIRRLPSYSSLVTDYSSMAFDFLLLNKPTIFFMFDREEYFRLEPPYVDIQTELPGPVASNASELLDVLFGPAGTLNRFDEAALRIHRARFIGFEGEPRHSENIVAAAKLRIMQQDGKLAADAAASLNPTL